ncbi:MAG: DegV family protein [Clostridiaceae bacterium]
MDYQIVADSCCDLTPEMKAEMNVISVPLTMTLGSDSYTDDEALDLPQFMAAMKACKERIGSAAPAPGMYYDAFSGSEESFAVTLSANLSGSYSSAMLGKSLAEEDGRSVHIFDSKSASAGEVLIVVKLYQLLRNGLPKLEIIERIERFIKEMKTFFVLDNVDTLRKNGRLSKIAGTIVSVLHLRPIMGADGEGHISLYSNAQGWKQALKKLADTIEASGKPTEGEQMVITHCNNPSMAEELKRVIEERYHFSEILVLPTRGLSSIYANEMGVIIAF